MTGIACAVTSKAAFHRVSPNNCHEIVSIENRSHIPRSSNDIRKLLNGLAELEFSPHDVSPLQKLAEAGSEYGLGVLAKMVAPQVLSLLRPQAVRHIKQNLQKILTRVTRPCYALELDAFRCAYQAIYSQPVFPSRSLIEEKFVGERPYERLVSLFTKFPVLGQLWCRLIRQWCDAVSEVLGRCDADKHELSSVFFRGQPVAEIVNLDGGLSDPHNEGRTVMRVQFQAGSIIYKPRSGDGEQEWFNLVRYLNAVSFRPKLAAARILCRDGYCWMQEVKSGPCKDETAARRFYKRLGGIIAAAYLIRAVDCHRDNVIASGELPVLVDAETLSHPESNNKATSPMDGLAATGFLPNSDRRSSYQYRSSTLARTCPGTHTPYIQRMPLHAARYEAVILSGFRRAWTCLIGTKARHIAFVRRVQRLQRKERRRIHRSTEAYDKILRASIEPAALRTRADRHVFIANSCRRSNVAEPVIRKEIEALNRLDIPYFVERSIAELRVPDHAAVPPEILEALRCAIRL